MAHSADGVQEACSQLGESGFINYFGLQRFGKLEARTHQVGQGMWRIIHFEVVILFKSFDMECASESPRRILILCSAHCEVNRNLIAHLPA